MLSCEMKGKLKGDEDFYNLVLKREKTREKHKLLNRISSHGSANARRKVPSSVPWHRCSYLLEGSLLWPNAF